jgi:serine/threonine-protein kinase
MQPGSELGRFRLLRVLDSDSCGQTWLALDGDSSERNVALKLMTSLASQGPNAAQRFVLETRQMACVRHPGLLPIHAVDITQGLPWMAMECATAGDLRAGFETQPLPCAEGLDALTDVAAALDHLHRYGIVPRTCSAATTAGCVCCSASRPRRPPSRTRTGRHRNVPSNCRHRPRAMCMRSA